MPPPKSWRSSASLNSRICRFEKPWKNSASHGPHFTDGTISTRLAGWRRWKINRPGHDTKSYFVSEASVYRLLKAHDLVPSPAFLVVKAADAFKDKTTAPNQLWQTDFTYLKVIGWAQPAKDPAMRKHRWM